MLSESVILFLRRVDMSFLKSASIRVIRANPRFRQMNNSRFRIKKTTAQNNPRQSALIRDSDNQTNHSSKKSASIRVICGNPRFRQMNNPKFKQTKTLQNYSSHGNGTPSRSLAARADACSISP